MATRRMWRRAQRRPLAGSTARVLGWGCGGRAGEQVQQRWAEESAWEVMIGPGFGPGRDYALYMATV